MIGVKIGAHEIRFDKICFPTKLFPEILELSTLALLARCSNRLSYGTCILSQQLKTGIESQQLRIES